MNIFIQTLAVFISVIALSVYLEAPKKHLVWCGILGAVGWIIYSLCSGIGNIWATFVCALAITLISHISARVLKAPLTIFLIPGILPLVPGAYLYRTIYEMLFGTKEKMQDNLIITIEIAGAIALAIFIMDSFFILFKKAAYAKKDRKFS